MGHGNWTWAGCVQGKWPISPVPNPIIMNQGSLLLKYSLSYIVFYNTKISNKIFLKKQDPCASWTLSENEEYLARLVTDLPRKMACII